MTMAGVGGDDSGERGSKTGWVWLPVGDVGVADGRGLDDQTKKVNRKVVIWLFFCHTHPLLICLLLELLQQQPRTSLTTSRTSLTTSTTSCCTSCCTTSSTTCCMISSTIYSTTSSRTSSTILLLVAAICLGAGGSFSGVGGERSEGHEDPDAGKGRGPSERDKGAKGRAPANKTKEPPASAREDKTPADL